MMKKFGLGENKRTWLGGGAVVAVVLLVAGWFIAIGPQLSAASADREQTAAAQQHNQLLQTRNDALEEKDGDRGALQAGLSAALEQLPSDGALPAFTRQLSAQAKAAGVVLTSVIVGTAVPVAGSGGQSATSGTATALSPAPGAPTTAATPAAAAPAGSTGLVQMTITINATGLGRHDLAFLRAIQWTGPRRALVSDVQLAPTTGGTATGIDGQCNLTVTMTIFSAPLSPSARADLEKLLSDK